MKCPYCSQEHPDGTKYCPETGNKIEITSLTCPSCQFRGIPMDSKFCPNCGIAITNQNPPKERTNKAITPVDDYLNEVYREQPDSFLREYINDDTIFCPYCGSSEVWYGTGSSILYNDVGYHCRACKHLWPKEIDPRFLNIWDMILGETTMFVASAFGYTDVDYVDFFMGGTLYFDTNDTLEWVCFWIGERRMPMPPSYEDLGFYWGMNRKDVLDILSEYGFIEKNDRFEFSSKIQNKIFYIRLYFEGNILESMDIHLSDF